MPDAARAWDERKEEVQLTIGQDKVKYFRLTISKLQNSGEFTGYLLMLYNNTEQINNEEHLKSIFAAVSDPLFILDKETGAILDVNDAACSLYGYSRDEMLQLKATDMSAEPQETRKSMDGPNTQIPVRYHKKKDGTVFMVEITASFFELNGRSVLATSMRDITDRKKAEQAQYESEMKYRSLVEKANEAIIIVQDGIFVFTNHKTYELLGMPDADFIGKQFIDLVWHEDREMITANYLKLFAGEKVADTYDFRIIGLEGQPIWIFISVSLIQYTGRPAMLILANNITQRKNAEEEMVKSYRSLTSIMDSIDAVVYVADFYSYDLLFLNKYAREIWGNMQGQKCWQIIQKNQNGPCSFCTNDKLLNIDGSQKGPYKWEFQNTLTEKWYDCSDQAIPWPGRGMVRMEIATEITERKLSEEKIIYLSFHDQLTGLYNRRFFEEELKRLDTVRQLPLSFIMGDLDGLKIINDVFGHAEGDKLLIEISMMLKEICRTDDILARWGGDEFVILLPRTTAADSEEIVSRIINKCNNTNTRKIPASLSLGTATKEKSAQDIQAVISDAEGNMYKNKLSQKDIVSSSIILALETALYEKNDETKERTDRIRRLAIRLGKSIKLPANQLDELSLLASLHDIGKVAIPEKILLKKGRLTEKEWSIIKRHPEIGFNIAKASPKIAHIAKPILSSHENFDGSGYPLGLKGDEIPVISRIIFIVAAYDMMIRERIYKLPMTGDVAIEELKRCAGIQFDPFWLTSL